MITNQKKHINVSSEFIFYVTNFIILLITLLIHQLIFHDLSLSIILQL